MIVVKIHVEPAMVSRAVVDWPEGLQGHRYVYVGTSRSKPVVVLVAVRDPITIGIKKY